MLFLEEAHNYVYSIFMKSRKAFIIFSLAIIFLLLSFIAFYFTRPLVLFVSSNEMYSEYFDVLQKPKRITFGYRTKFISEEDESTQQANLLILDSLASLNESIDGIKIATIGSTDNYDISLKIDINKLWPTALIGKVAFAFSDDDFKAEEVFSYLKSIYPDIIALNYKGRVSDVNFNELASVIEDERIDSLLVYDPQTSLRLFDIPNVKFYVDFRDYPALSSLKNIVSIAPDWDSAIKKALSIDSGDISFDFTLIRSH